MKLNRTIKRFLSIALSCAMIAGTSGMYELATNVKFAKALSMDATIDEDTYLTEAEIKDTTLCQVLRVIANYTKARTNVTSLPELTGDENLLSEAYAAYQEDAFTFGDLKAYTGPIDLTNYANNIHSIEGLGYARGASSFDIGACTEITSIPDNEFGACTMTSFTMSSAVTSIGNNAFQQCSRLTDIKIIDKAYDDDKHYTDLSYIKNIGNYAFDGCTSLSNVTLYSGTPELVIGISAFSNCSSITAIEIPVKNAANLGESAFAGCKALSSVTLYDELDYLPANIFSNTSINKVMIYDEAYTGTNFFPSGLTYIGKNAFQDSTLGSLDFSRASGMTYIGEYSFAGSYFTSLKFPNGLKQIDALAFNSASSLYLELPNSVTTIKEGAFKTCSIISIKVSSNVETIEASTFEGSQTAFIEFTNEEDTPGKLTTISNSAFKNCANLQSVNLQGTDINPRSSILESIGAEAFYGCSSLTDTHFLDYATQLTSIGNKAFASCCQYNKDQDPETKTYERTIYGEWIYTGLTTITLPNSVTTLGTNVFANNYALTEVNLGSGVTSLPDGAFKMDDTVHSMLQKVILSDKLTTIGKESFKNNNRLRTMGTTDGTTVKVTAGVATLPSALTSIGDNAFMACGATHILNYLYKQSGGQIKGVKKWFNVSDIHTDMQSGDMTLLIYEPGYSELKQVYLDPSKALEEEPKEEEIDESLRCIYIVAKKIWLDDSVSEGQNTDIEIISYGEKDYGYEDYIDSVDKITVTEDQISTTAIDGCDSMFILYGGSTKSAGIGTTLNPRVYTGLTDVVLPASLKDTEDNKALGNGVWEGCIALDNVSMSTGVTALSNRSFYGCSGMVYDWTNSKTVDYTYIGLKSVTGLDKLTSIGDYCFYNCYNYDLEQDNFGGKTSTALSSIGKYAFFNCRSLTTVVLHSAITSIGEGAFKNCAEINPEAFLKYSKPDNTEVTYKYNQVIEPSKASGHGLRAIDFTTATKLASIGNEAFAYTALTTVNLPDAKITAVPNGLFMGCSLLTTATVPSSVKSIGTNAFKDCESLITLQMPASATIAANILNGATPSTISGLVLTSEANKKVSVPLRQEVTLPVIALKSDTRSGSYKITIYEDDNDLTGTVVYDNSAPVTGTAYDDIINVDIIYGDTKTSDIIKLTGCETVKRGMIVKVEANSAFGMLDGKSFSIINSQTFTYKVDVTEIPTTDISLTESQGTASFITENDASGATNNMLYIAKGSSATIQADITPYNTTDTCTWEVANPDIVSLGEPEYTYGKGKISINALTTGNTKITVNCGTISKDIYVYVKVPAYRLTAGTDSCTLTTSSATFDLPLGDTDKITAVTTYNTSSYSEQEWADYPDVLMYTSSDSSIVNVTSDGSLSALKVGTAYITVKALASRRTVTFTINVVNDADYNSLFGKSITAIEGGSSVYINESIQLNAVLDPVKATNGIVWSTDSGSISADGLFTAGDTPGYANVTATMLDKDGNVTRVTKTVSISILQGASSIELTEATSNINMYTGESFTLTKTTKETTRGYKLVPSTSTDSVTAESSDESIATVETKGTTFTVKGTGQGEVNIILTSTSGATISVPVKVIEPISSISLPETASVERNETIKLTPVIVPAGSVEAYRWSSSKPAIATVDDNGLVTGISLGTTKITATTNKGISVTCTVSVTQKSTALNITKAGKELTIYCGETSTLTKTTSDTTAGYNFTPNDSTDKVACTSANEAIASATVDDASGYITITGVKQGKTTITLKASSGVTNTVTVNVITPIETIALPESTSVEKGSTLLLNPDIVPSDSLEQITWSSSSDSIVTVDQMGLVTAVGLGTATITAKTGKKVTATCTVKVTLKASAINLTSKTKNIELYTGESLTLSKTTKETSYGYNLTPTDTTDSVTCTSSDENIAAVTASGSKFTITAKAQGVVNITLTADSKVTAVIPVKVTAPITSIKLPETATVVKGKQLALTPSITPANSLESYTWSSSKESVATVSANGLVNGVSSGTVKITVRSSRGVSSTCTVTVVIPTTKLTLRTSTNQRTLYMAVNSSISIGCKCDPSDTTDTITYTSTKSKIATVSGSGTYATISAKKKGTAKIIIKTSSGKSVTLTIKVVKKSAPAKKVKLSGKKSVKVGKTIQLTAKFTNKTSTDTVTWSSSNSAKASVNSYGEVTGIKKGTVKITAKASSGKTATIKVKIK